MNAYKLTLVPLIILVFQMPLMASALRCTPKFNLASCPKKLPTSRHQPFLVPVLVNSNGHSDFEANCAKINRKNKTKGNIVGTIDICEIVLEKKTRIIFGYTSTRNDENPAAYYRGHCVIPVPHGGSSSYTGMHELLKCKQHCCNY